MQSKITMEVAEAEFNRFCETMDLDVNPEGMAADDLREFETLKRRVLNAMIEGSLTVNEKGEPVFRPKKTDQGIPAEIVFAEPRGAAYMAMDLRKKGHDVSKMYAIYGEITGQNPKVFSSMYNRDLKVVQSIVTLFLA